MSGIQCCINYVRARPLGIYLVGGVALAFGRDYFLKQRYNEHFGRFDVERRMERLAIEAQKKSH